MAPLPRRQHQHRNGLLLLSLQLWGVGLHHSLVSSLIILVWWTHAGCDMCDNAPAGAPAVPPWSPGGLHIKGQGRVGACTLIPRQPGWTLRSRQPS